MYVHVQVTEYTHGSLDLLGVQIDAAINGGNSGGPVFNKKGQCVGIAFQVSGAAVFSKLSRIHQSQQATTGHDLLWVCMQLTDNSLKALPA